MSRASREGPAAETPETYGYDPTTWERAGVARDAARAVFGKVMFLVAVTAGFAALGAYVGRDLSGGWAFACWGLALVLVIGIGMGRRREAASQLQLTMLFGVGLLLGLSVGPALVSYASLEDGGALIAQAAGLTALFMAGLGTAGYLTRRDLTRVGQVSFVALIGLILFGIVAIFVNIPGERLIWCIGGLVVFAGLTLFDFWRLRRAGEEEVAVIALSIFLDAFNVFLLMLQLLGGSRD